MFQTMERFSHRQKFTKQEDQQLVRLVKKHGTKNWEVVASFMPRRCGRQCRDRYNNYLLENFVKGQWTDEEDQMIFRLYELIGPHWSKISKSLPGRSGNDVKNRWHKKLSKIVDVKTVKEEAENLIYQKNCEKDVISRKEGVACQLEDVKVKLEPGINSETNLTCKNCQNGESNELIECLNMRNNINLGINNFIPSLENCNCNCNNISSLCLKQNAEMSEQIINNCLKQNDINNYNLKPISNNLFLNCNQNQLYTNNNIKISSLNSSNALNKASISNGTNQINSIANTNNLTLLNNNNDNRLNTTNTMNSNGNNIKTTSSTTENAQTSNSADRADNSVLTKKRCNNYLQMSMNDNGSTTTSRVPGAKQVGGVFHCFSFYEQTGQTWNMFPTHQEEKLLGID